MLIAAIDQRCAAVRALLIQHADLALGVAKHHQVFTQDPGANGGAIGLRHLFGQAHHLPVAAHQLAHRGIALDTAHQHVFFVGQHW